MSTIKNLIKGVVFPYKIFIKRNPKPMARQITLQLQFEMFSIFHNNRLLKIDKIKES
jgi:hypothetical protein